MSEITLISWHSHFGHDEFWNCSFKAKENSTNSCPRSQELSKQTLPFSKPPRSAPSRACFLCALQESRSGDVVNRHMTFPTWALFKPEEKGMWPLQVICGILQLSLSFASIPTLLFSHSTSCTQCMCVSGVWTSAAAWVLKTDTSRHRCNTLADFAETFSLCHGLKSQSTWAQAVQDSCSLQRTPDSCHLKSLSRLFYLCFPSYTGCGIAVLYFTAHFFEAKLLCTL